MIRCAMLAFPMHFTATHFSKDGKSISKTLNYIRLRLATRKKMTTLPWKVKVNSFDEWNHEKDNQNYGN